MENIGMARNIRCVKKSVKEGGAVISITTPVVIFGFNRHNNIRLMREAMANLKFDTVYFIIDGPRPHRLREQSKVEETLLEMKAFNNISKTIIIKSEVNLGCKRRILTGLKEVFELESQVIVLEDDCIPVPEFFEYCEKALQKFREDPSVALISGSNLLCDKFSNQESAGKSIFINCWGWAGWRDKTWNLIDKDCYLADIKHRLKDSKTFKSLPVLERVYWTEILKHAVSSNTVWDFYLQLGLFQNENYSVYPPHNLIDNIGFDDTATHTKFGVPEFVKNNPAKNEKVNFEIASDCKDRSSTDILRDKQITRTLYKYSIFGLIRLMAGNIIRFAAY